MPTEPDLILIKEYRQAFIEARHRLPVHLAGEQDWVRTKAAELSALLGGLEQVYWLGRSEPTVGRLIRGEEASSLLGTEMDALVVDAWDGFNPDAFGALSGTVRAGGMLILLTPPLAGWYLEKDPEHAKMQVEGYAPEDVHSRFVQRLSRLMAEDSKVLRWYQGEAPMFPERRVHGFNPVIPSTTAMEEGIAPCLTLDQHSAVEAVEKVVRGQRRRPLVLVSDRGRGKSSALGIAAHRLHRQGVDRIVVTAPVRNSTKTLFDRVEEQDGTGLRAEWLRFVPLPELLETRPELGLLLVDEAAGIPVEQLTRLLMHYPRIVFASTVHGYEGCGRGFDIRFRQVLDKHSRGWRHLEIHQPIRWAEHDPLEALSFRLLMLDAEPATPEPLPGNVMDGVFSEVVDRKKLHQDESLLGQVFGLLVLAHYRTRPSDLRYLLDSPNLSILLLRRGDHVLATALVAEEGGMEASLARDIAQGRRRPRGHLVPEALASHLGLEEAPERHNGRVVRIVVHPALHRHALGSRLLKDIQAFGQSRGWDYLATSFGVEPGLLAFWCRSGYAPVRLGSRANRSSGEHSVLMLKGLTEPGHALCQKAAKQFSRDFPQRLAGSLNRIDPLLAWALVTQLGMRPPEGAVEDWDRQSLMDFVRGYRDYEEVEASLFRLIAMVRHDNLEDSERLLLVCRVMQGRTWGESARLSGKSGRAGCVKSIRNALIRLFDVGPL